MLGGTVLTTGFGRKKPLASALPFSLLVCAEISCPSTVIFNTGILSLPPSVADIVMYQLAVQMSGSSAFLSQSLQ